MAWKSALENGPLYDDDLALDCVSRFPPSCTAPPLVCSDLTTRNALYDSIATSIEHTPILFMPSTPPAPPHLADDRHQDCLCGVAYPAVEACPKRHDPHPRPLVFTSSSSASSRRITHRLPVASSCPPRSAAPTTPAPLAYRQRVPTAHRSSRRPPRLVRLGRHRSFRPRPLSPGGRGPVTLRLTTLPVGLESVVLRGTLFISCASATAPQPQIEVYVASRTPIAAPPPMSHHSHGSQASHTSYASSSSRASSSHAAHASSSSHASYASHPSTSPYASSEPAATTTKRWGDRPVPLLLSIRLGLDDVNPVYYETIKMLYTFPQSVGIAGGRPSSSYYFVGVQGDGLFYLDPHHSRPAIPPRPRPTPSAQFGSSTSEPPASRAGSQEPRVGSLEARAASPPIAEGELVLNAQRAEDAAEEDASGMARAEAAFYQRAHAPVVLRTFHCEKVRKMPLSGLDPCMLLGFVCRDEGEWVDLRRRTAADDLCDPGRAADVDDDDDMDLESVSDPEEEEAVDADDGEGSMRFFDEGPSSVSHGVSSSASHTHASTHYHSNSNSTTSSARTRSEEADTEEDPVAHPREWKVEEGEEKKDKQRKTKKAAAVPVPRVHYPFPLSTEAGATGAGQQQQRRAEERERERQRNVLVSPRPTAQGRGSTCIPRDGRRTLSWGVRGVLTADA
ncbi:hypothetical protein C8J57DRAFT_1734527 [Mycena rebaudengoi]|nr:hypothetical protein C8J57DRAFT_1734527 [Mycena rebaudengoi]